MLVLSRKLGEKIYVGENIRITVVDIDGGKIRLGIEAPRDVPIYRQELTPGSDYGCDSAGKRHPWDS
jgi:carbon storage regulator